MKGLRARGRDEPCRAERREAERTHDQDGRPATDREDHAVKFSEAQAGMYAAELRLAPGQWVVQLQSEELSRAGDPAYRLKQRILIPESP